MALSINNTLTEMRVAAGEPIVFSYQPQDISGTPETLDGRAFVLAIYDDKRANLGQYNAIVKTGDNPLALWKLTGQISESLLGKSNLKWEIAERLDDGRDIIANGQLTISVSAPAIMDYDNAPISRYITQIVRLNDQTTKDAPVFRVKPTLYTEKPPAPVFSVLPTISPKVGQVGATFTANDGTASNTATYTRRWLLSGTAIGTGSTVVPVSTGDLVLEVTASGIGGSTVATSVVSTVAAKLTITGTPAAAIKDMAYSFTPTVAGGSGTKVFAITGTLPNGLAFSTTTGAITGTPTTVSTATVSITVTDDSGSATLANLSLVVATIVRTTGLMTATRDGSVGQVYTAPSGMTGIQWYREALSSDLTKTALNVTTSTYTATASDVGYRLVVRGMMSNALIDAPAYDPVYAAPVIVESFDSATALRVGNGTMANASAMVQGSGSVELTGNGANNSVNVFRNTGQMLDLATVGTISMAFDFGSESLLQDGDYGGPGLNVATSNAAWDQGSGGSVIDASTGSNPINSNMVGRRWMSYNIAEYNNLPAPGYAVPSARVGWKSGSAYAGKVKCDALVRNSGGRATIVLSADDGMITQYTALYPAFRDRGLNFTLFPARDNIAKGDAGNSANFMTTAMLNEMYASGLVDIGVDTYDDAPLTGDTDIAAALQHADTSRQWVLSKGWTRAANHMCYPNGSADLSNRKTITDFKADGTAIITMASTTGLTAGMDVAGLGVPTSSGVKIVSVDSATQVTLNQNLAAGTYRVNCAVTSAPFFGAKLAQALTGAGWLTGRTTSPKLVVDRFGITSDEAMTLTSQSMSNQTFADTKKYIDLAVKRGCMLYLYGHSWTATGGLNYSPSEMILLADYLKSLKDQGLIDVSTISQWWNAASRRNFPL